MNTEKISSILLIVSLVLACGSLGNFVYAAATFSFTTIIEEGSGVETASYTIFVDGSTYYAKNGSTGEIVYSGTNFSSLMTSVIACSDVAKIHLRRGTYEVYNRITVDKRLTIEGEGEATIINTNTSQLNGTFLIQEHATLRDFRLNTIGNVESTDLLDIGIYFDGLSPNTGEFSMMENLFINRFGIGLLFDDVIQYNCYDIELYNCYIGVQIEGTSWTTVSDYIDFFGGRIAAARSYPLYIDYGKHCHFYGTIFEDYTATTYLRLDNFRDITFHGCHFEAKTANSYGIYTSVNDTHRREGLDITDCAFDLVNNGYGIHAYNITTLNIERTTIGNVGATYYFLNATECEDVRLISPLTEGITGTLYTGNGIYLDGAINTGNETAVSNGDWITHYLPDTPFIIILTPRSNITVWVNARNSTHFQIGVASGTTDLDWIAQYKP